MRSIYVYMTTCLVNNKKYIGHHSWDGEGLDPKYFGSGVNIKKALKKYGKENFTCEIIESCNSDVEAYQKEKKWIDFYDAVDNPEFYNISSGGFDDCRAGLTQEQKEDWKHKIGDAQRGCLNHRWGTHPSEETRRKLSEANKGENNPMYGKHLSEESRKKLSEALKGTAPPNKGVPMSGERLLQHHIAMKKLAKDPVWREHTLSKLAEYNQSEKAKHNRDVLAKSRRMKVLQFDMDGNFIQEFPSGAEAGRQLGIAKGNIAKCCRGEISSAYGFRWQYAT